VSAGGIVLGKSSLPPLGSVHETENDIVGVTYNPYGPGRLSPSGSGGGGAAAVAAGMSPLSVGTDLGGSLRFPAVLCGLSALKPTRGRVPSMGMEGWSMFVNLAAHIGFLSRSAKDLSLALQIVEGPDGKDPYAVVPVRELKLGPTPIEQLRVAFYTTNGDPHHEPVDSVQEAVRVAARTLHEHVRLVREDRPEGVELAREVQWGLLLPTFMEDILAAMQRFGMDQPHKVMEPHIRAIEHVLPKYPKTFEQHRDAEAAYDLFMRRMTRFMQGYDVLISPVSTIDRLECGAFHRADGKWQDPADRLWNCGAYFFVHNITGFPTVIVRTGLTPDGLPVGVEIAARPWHDHVALQVAECLERSLGGFLPPSL
jgi:amidase